MSWRSVFLKPNKLNFVRSSFKMWRQQTDEEPAVKQRRAGAAGAELLGSGSRLHRPTFPSFAGRSVSSAEKHNQFWLGSHASSYTKVWLWNPWLENPEEDLSENITVTSKQGQYKSVCYCGCHDSRWKHHQWLTTKTSVPQCFSINTSLAVGPYFMFSDT